MLLITFTVKFNIKRIDIEVHFLLFEYEVVYNMFKLMILQQLLSLSLYEDFGTYVLIWVVIRCSIFMHLGSKMN